LNNNTDKYLFIETLYSTYTTTTTTKMESKRTPGRVTIRKPKGKKKVTEAVRAVARDETKRVLSRELETKYAQPSTGIQTVFASNAANTGVYWQDVTSAISQGVGDFGNRVGDAIVMNNIIMNYTIFAPPGATTGISNCVRVMLVQYKRSDNAPSSAELLRTTTVVTGANAYSAYSFINRDYRKFYHILYDKRHVVVSNNAAALSTPSAYRFDKQVMIRKMDHKIQYTAASTQAVNPIFFFAIGDQATIAQNPNVAANFFLTYKDA